MFPRSVLLPLMVKAGHRTASRPVGPKLGPGGRSRPLPRSVGSRRTRVPEDGVRVRSASCGVSKRRSRCDARCACATHDTRLVGQQRTAAFRSPGVPPIWARFLNFREARHIIRALSRVGSEADPGGVIGLGKRAETPSESHSVAYATQLERPGGERCGEAAMDRRLRAAKCGRLHRDRAMRDAA